MDIISWNSGEEAVKLAVYIMNILCEVAKRNSP